MAIAIVGSSISSQLVDLDIADIAGAFSVSADEASWIACVATMAEVASIPIAAILVRALSLRTVVLCSASLYALCACMSFFSPRARNPLSCCAQPRVFAAAGVKAHSAVDQATANLAYENQQLVVIDTNEAVAKARVDSGEAALLSAKLALADTAVWAPIEHDLWDAADDAFAAGTQEASTAFASAACNGGTARTLTHPNPESACACRDGSPG